MVSKHRSPLPITKFGDKATRTLYARFHAMKNKAANKGVPFQWEKFDEFLRDLLSKAPADYHPDTHRVRFDLSLGGGYRSRSLMIMRKGGQAAHGDVFPEVGYLSAGSEMATLMLTEEGPLIQLVAEALRRCRR